MNIHVIETMGVNFGLVYVSPPTVYFRIQSILINTVSANQMSTDIIKLMTDSYVKHTFALIYNRNSSTVSL